MDSEFARSMWAAFEARWAPIERELALLRPLAAEALVREISEAAMLDGTR